MCLVCSDSHWCLAGAGIDSYFEYLVKAAGLLQRPELMAIFKQAWTAIEKHLRHEDWYLWATMTKGYVTMAVFQSLEAYWPGVLTLVGGLVIFCWRDLAPHLEDYVPMSCFFFFLHNLVTFALLCLCKCGYYSLCM